MNLFDLFYDKNNYTVCAYSIIIRGQSMNSILMQLHNNHQIWHGNNHHTNLATISSGDAALDDYLNGGFPQASVIEIQSINGIGELRLLMPLLTSQLGLRHLVFVTPPSNISSHMLASHGISGSQTIVLSSDVEKHTLWSVEQCLKSGCVGAIVLWHQQFTTAQIKRFKLSAQQGQATLIIIRQPIAHTMNLPVQLSLSLTPHQHGLLISINKQLGYWPKAPYLFDMRRHWPDLVVPKLPDNVVMLHQRQVG